MGRPTVRSRSREGEGRRPARFVADIAAFLVSSLLFLALPAASWGASSSPGEVRIGVVMERLSAEIAPPLAHASGQGWCAAVNLAGVPYSALLLEDLLAAGADSALRRWDGLILTACRYVPDERYAGLCDFLESYLAGGGGLIVDGPPALRDGAGARRNSERIEEVLGAEYVGFRGDTRHRIRVERADHPITRACAPGEMLTQCLDDGLRILRFREGGAELLSSWSAKDGFPYLSVREGDGKRIALLSDFAASAGTAISFRNHEPSGFYPNRLYDCIVPLVQWVVYGSVDDPVPALQLVNADAAVLARLDADWSWNGEVQEKAVRFLTGMARESGVSTVYGVVTASAAASGWERIAPLLREIESAGGIVATHSRRHIINGDLDEESARSELDSSVAEMELGLREAGGPDHPIDWFINPNDQLPMGRYGLIAERFPVFLTHGYSQNVPHAYGVMEWFCGAGRDLFVLNCSSSPDYEWFYAEGWERSVSEVSALQESIFDHMLRDVRRGVLFHPMWHDYSISSRSLVKPTWRTRLPRFLGGGMEKPPSHAPYYEGMAARFASSPIYAPRPVELTRKLRVMADCGFSWTSSERRADVEIRLPREDPDSLASSTGGMAVRIENPPGPIVSVRLNGREHRAFRDDRVILPDLEPGTNRIAIEFGPAPFRGTRLVYVSQRLSSVRVLEDGDVEARISSRSRARFTFETNRSCVLIGADMQSLDRPPSHAARGVLFTDGTVRVHAVAGERFVVVESTVPFLDYREGEGRVEIVLGGTAEEEKRIRFHAASPPRAILLDGEAVRVTRDEDGYAVELPRSAARGGTLCVIL
ncbi:MAG: hypothetical protein JW958_10455 [Candidatus Eisenbacteria bacterium]|nr:hypothetical protein [Candidatus Eisenbacteria bacterium]